MIGLSTLSRLIPEASAALCAILDATRGPVQLALRSEIFGQQRFAQHGRSLGETHHILRGPARVATFYPRLHSNIQVLREVHDYIGTQAASGYDVSPAAEWLLDNFHLIEAQLMQIHEGLPRRYFRELPVLRDEPLAGLPRVYGVAWAFVAHTDGAFNEELLEAFLVAYQETRELKLSETWALPTTLRVVLVENLRRLAERIAAQKAARQLANLCCDCIATLSVSTLNELLVQLEQRGVSQVFLAQMALRLQDPETGPQQVFSPPSRGGSLARSGRFGDTAHHDWLQQAIPDLASVQAQHSADQAADNLSVSNAVKSLRDIDNADWSHIVARTSTLMRWMLGAAVFEAEHVNTRDQTLHGIEQLSKRSGHSELMVAQQLLALMQSSNKPHEALVGVPCYWLMGPGRAQLLHTLGLREHRWLSSLTLPVYLAVLSLTTGGLVAWLLWPLSASLSWMNLLGCAGLMLFPTSEAVVAVMNRLISESAKPQHVPRLALEQGIPPEHRVLVVVPAMLSDETSIDALVRRLELHYLANPQKEAQFALLSDWADASTEQLEGDAALLEHAVQGIRALNTRHLDGLCSAGY